MAQVQLPSLCTPRSDFFKSVQPVATLHESTAFLSKPNEKGKSNRIQIKLPRSGANTTTIGVSSACRLKQSQIEPFNPPTPPQGSPKMYSTPQLTKISL